MQAMLRFRNLTACILTSFLMLGVATPPQAQAALRIAVAYAPKTLDPSIATDAASARLLQLTHPALMVLGPNAEPVPLAAQSCTQQTLALVTCILPTNKTYTDGTPLTALTVRDWLTTLATTTRSPFASSLKNVTIEATDERSLAFTLTSPTLTFLNTLAEIPLANPTNPSAGLGPYKATTHDALGNVTLAAPGKPTLQFLYVQDPTTRLLKLKKGEVDLLVGDLTPDLITWARRQNFPVTSTPGSSYTYLGLNFQNPLLADVQVRAAIATALDRPAIRKYLLGGLAEPAYTLLPPHHPAAWDAVEESPDAGFAAAILDRAGYEPKLSSDARISLTLLTSTDSFAQRVAQVIQSQMAAAGIELKLRPTEFAAFYDAVKKGQFDMVLLTWTGDQSPAFYHALFNSAQTPPAGLNRGRFSSPLVDDLTTQILAAPTHARQYELAVQLQKALAELRPYIPLYRRHQILVTAPNVTGCTLPPSGAYTGLPGCYRK